MLRAPDEQSEEIAAAWALVTSAQQGDTAAFGRLYDQYAGFVHRYVLARVRSRDVAEDLTSETFLRAFRALKTATYRGRPFPAWLVTIARHLVLDFVKSGYHRREVVGGDFAGDEGTQRSAESQVIDREVRTMLWRCVGQLPPAQRDCLHLRFRLDLSVAETAEVMGRPVAAIRQLQYRASRNLGVNWTLSHA